MDGPTSSLTDDEAMLAVPAPGRPATRGGDEVLLARVRAELETGFEALSGVERAVSVFGSARTPPEDPDYQLARASAAQLGRDGFAIITGGGPGIMEAANRGAKRSMPCRSGWGSNSRLRSTRILTSTSTFASGTSSRGR